MSWADVEGGGCGVLWCAIPQICLRGLRKNMHNLSTDGFPGYDMQAGSPACETKILHI